MLKVLKNKELINKFNRIALPVMLSSLITFFVSLLDNLMVGTVSNDAVSGVYAANQISFVFYMCIFGVLEGAGIFIQQFNGTNDHKRISESFIIKWRIVIVTLLITVPLFYIFSKDLIYIQCFKDKNSNDILSLGIRYFNIVGLSYIPQGIMMIYSSTFQETGNTKYPMYSSIIALVSNVLFNSLFIFVFKMGVVGAAIATLISRVVEMLFLIIITNVKKMSYSLSVRGKVVIEKELSINILKKTLFLFINEMGYAFGVLLQSFAFSQRDSVLSSISIVSMVTELFHVFAVGISVSIGVIVGSDLGRSDFENARNNTKDLIKFGILITLLISLVLILLSPLIPKLYMEVDEAQKELGTYLIIVLSCALPFQTFAMGTYYTLRAGGRTFDTMIFDTGSTLLLYVPISWILAVCTNLPLLYIYIIVRAIDIVKAFGGMYLLKTEKWLNNITI